MSKRHDFYQLSQCRNQYFHRFSIISEYPEGVMELCEICRMTKFFRVIDGRLNNEEYMSYHLRQALPRFHPYYDHEYRYDPLSGIIESPYGI